MTTSTMHPQFVRIARNSVFNVARFVILLPLPLLVVPVMLNRLGAEGFGVWTLMTLLTSYTTLADFGMGLALTRDTAKYAAQNQWDVLNETVNTVFFFYLAVAIILSTVIFGARYALAEILLHASPTLIDNAAFMIGIAAIAFGINLAFGAFGSVLTGLQRMELTNAISFLNSVALYGGIVILLALGFGLRELAILNLCIAVATAIANAWLALRLAPHLQLSWRRFDLRRLRQIFGYSVNVQGGALAELLFDPATKLMLTVSLGIGFVTQYDVGLRVTGQLRNLFAVALTPVFPGVSHLQAANEPTAVNTIFHQAIRYIFMLALPAYALLAVAAPWFLQAWLGAGYEQASFAMRVMTIGWFFSLLATPAYLVLQALGHARLCFIAHVVQGFLNVILALAFVATGGFFGVTLAAFVGLTTGSLLVIAFYQRTQRVAFGKIARAIPWRAVGATAVLSSTLLVLLTKTPTMTLSGLGALGIACAILYAGALFWLGVVNETDWRLLSAVLPKQWGRTRLVLALRARGG